MDPDPDPYTDPYWPPSGSTGSGSGSVKNEYGSETLPLMIMRNENVIFPAGVVGGRGGRGGRLGISWKPAWVSPPVERLEAWKPSMPVKLDRKKAQEERILEA